MHHNNLLHNEGWAFNEMNFNKKQMLKPDKNYRITKNVLRLQILLTMIYHAAV